MARWIGFRIRVLIEDCGVKLGGFGVEFGGPENLKGWRERTELAAGGDGGGGDVDSWWIGGGWW